jgi:predicted dehydrogenase
MATSPVRIAIVGLDHWYWAFGFAESAQANKDVELVAIADHQLERAREAAERFGVERATGEPRELIEDRQIDVIASFVSVDQNPAICVAAARAGKHLFSVKPLARTLPEATDILHAVREAGVLFLPAESVLFRLSAQYQQIKEWIGEGRLGRILAATYSQHAGLPQSWPGNSDSGWFIDAERGPGGGWIDHSIYHIDVLRWLLQDEIRSIGGRAGRLKYPDLPFEDYGAATIEFDSGALANVEVTWIAPPGGGRTSWSIIGTEGAVSYDSLTGRFAATGNFPPFNGWVQTAARATSNYGLEHLVACVRGEATPIATVEDAWRNLAACLAFYDAAQSGSAIAPASIPAE